MDSDSGSNFKGYPEYSNHVESETTQTDTYKSHLERVPTHVANWIQQQDLLKQALYRRSSSSPPRNGEEGATSQHPSSSGATAHYPPPSARASGATVQYPAPSASGAPHHPPLVGAIAHYPSPSTSAAYHDHPSATQHYPAPSMSGAPQHPISAGATLHYPSSSSAAPHHTAPNTRQYPSFTGATSTQYPSTANTNMAQHPPTMGAGTQYPSSSTSGTPQYASLPGMSMYPSPAQSPADQSPVDGEGDGRPARGASKPERAKYSRAHLDVLNYIFTRQRYPTLSQQAVLARRLGLKAHQIKFWFQNRRRKDPNRNIAPVPSGCLDESVMASIYKEMLRDGLRDHSGMRNSPEPPDCFRQDSNMDDSSNDGSESQQNSPYPPYTMPDTSTLQSGNVATTTAQSSQNENGSCFKPNGNLVFQFQNQESGNFSPSFDSTNPFNYPAETSDRGPVYHTLETPNSPSGVICSQNENEQAENKVESAKAEQSENDASCQSQLQKTNGNLIQDLLNRPAPSFDTTSARSQSGSHTVHYGAPDRQQTTSDSRNQPQVANVTSGSSPDAESKEKEKAALKEYEASVALLELLDSQNNVPSFGEIKNTDNRDTGNTQNDDDDLHPFFDLPAIESNHSERKPTSTFDESSQSYGITGNNSQGFGKSSGSPKELNLPDQFAVPDSMNATPPACQNLNQISPDAHPRPGFSNFGTPNPRFGVLDRGYPASMPDPRNQGLLAIAPPYSHLQHHFNALTRKNPASQGLLQIAQRNQGSSHSQGSGEPDQSSQQCASTTTKNSGPKRRNRRVKPPVEKPPYSIMGRMGQHVPTMRNDFRMPGEQMIQASGGQRMQDFAPCSQLDQRSFQFSQQAALGGMAFPQNPLQMQFHPYAYSHFGSYGGPMVQGNSEALDYSCSERKKDNGTDPSNSKMPAHLTSTSGQQQSASSSCAQQKAPDSSKDAPIRQSAMVPPFYHSVNKPGLSQNGSQNSGTGRPEISQSFQYPGMPFPQMHPSVSDFATGSMFAMHPDPLVQHYAHPMMMNPMFLPQMAPVAMGRQQVDPRIQGGAVPSGPYMINQFMFPTHSMTQSGSNNDGKQKK